MKGYNFYNKMFRQLKKGDIAYKVDLSSYEIEIVKVDDIKLIYTQDHNRMAMAILDFSDGQTFKVGAYFSSDFTIGRTAYYTTERKFAEVFVKTLKENAK